MDFDFDAERRANITALNDGTSNPDVVGRETAGAKRVVKGTATGITNQGMSGIFVTVLIAELVEVGEVLELAVAVGGFAREGPVTGRSRGRPGRKPDDGGRNALSCEPVAHEEVGGRPWLGEIGNVGNARIGLGGMRQGGIGVGWRRRDFDLRSGLDLSLFGRFRSGKPADGTNDNNPDDGQADNERKQRIGSGPARTGRRNAWNVRHFGLQVSGGLMVCHSA